MCARCSSRIRCCSSAASPKARSRWALNCATSTPSTPSRLHPRASVSPSFGRWAAAFGRTPGFNVSVRPIIAAREGEAWDKANRILAAMSGKKGWQRQEEAKGPVDNAGQRLMRFALERDVHDERLWMPIARATGALGNTSCLVGTPEQVAEALLRYYMLGVDSFLIRGFDPLNDAIEFGRELIPRIKAGALEIDRRRAAE